VLARVCGKSVGLTLQWPIIVAMPCITCDRSPIWRELSRAAAKSAGARLRRMGILPLKVDWPARAIICERCPLRVIQGRISYCGRPLLDQIRRSSSIDGCGCPTIDKAKDPHEHCPLDRLNQPAKRVDGVCSCKWCGEQ
jgi:hypothetical protein